MSPMLAGPINLDWGLVVIIYGLIVLIGLYTLGLAVTFWRLFDRAGYPGWAAIVPVYNFIIAAKVGGQPWWLGLVGGVSYLASRQEIQGKVGFELLGIGIALWLIAAMARRYDRSVGFWLLVVVLPWIAMFRAGRATYKAAPKV